MMERDVKRSKEGQYTSLMDLNENIFHEIFQYVPYKDLHLHVRNTSKILSSLVESYIHLDKSFLLYSTTKRDFYSTCMCPRLASDGHYVVKTLNLKVFLLVFQIVSDDKMCIKLYFHSSIQTKI